MTNSLAALAGRIFLALIFLDSGIEKFTQLSSTVAYVAKFGLPFPKALMILSGIVEIGCAVLLILGWRTRLAAIGLVIWMIPVTLIFHNPASGGEAMVHFMKNLAITGGLLVLFASGPGPWSLGRSR